MLESANGRKLAAAMPRDRVVPESDGPFAKVRGAPLMPWDANTVTHVLGVRAFSTQLLCEQVVGRALRRTSYVTNPDDDLFPPEYAEVYGVPFSFIPSNGSTGDAGN